MKNIYLFLIFIVLLQSCGNKGNKNDADEIKSPPTDTLNNLFNITSEAELLKIFGEENLTKDSTYNINGEKVDINIIYPKTKDQVEIYWTKKDGKNAIITIKQAAFFDDTSSSYLLDTRWETSFGIKLGTTLKEIEELNGCPFIFYGFGWDNGGFISEFNGGKLSKLPIALQINIADTKSNANNPDYENLLGNREFNSSDEEAQRLNPVVHSITIFKK